MATVSIEGVITGWDKRMASLTGYAADQVLVTTLSWLDPVAHRATTKRTRCERQRRRQEEARAHIIIRTCIVQTST
jgi:PAS domain-containing protein